MLGIIIATPDTAASVVTNNIQNIDIPLAVALLMGEKGQGRAMTVSTETKKVNIYCWEIKI